MTFLGALARGIFSAVILLLSASPIVAGFANCFEGRVELDSDPGELIGHGESLRFDRSDASPIGFLSRTEGFPRDGSPPLVRVLFFGSGNHWLFEFSSQKLEGGLVPGDYPGAMRRAKELPGRPGLNVSGNHRGWSVLNGSFRILEASYGTRSTTLEVRRFVAEFEQRGHDFPETLWGRVECFNTLLIPIDVRPGSDEITLNLTSRGVVPIALLGAENFDLEDIDRSTLAFGPGRAAPVHRTGGHVGDVNGDGREDLIVHLRVADLGVALGERTLCVDGTLVNHRILEGCDQIHTTFGYGATAIALDAEFPGRGWFDSNGRHDETNDNTFTGSFKGFDWTHNSFFIWNVSALAGMRVESATLRIGQDRYYSRELSETIEVYPVSHSRDALVSSYESGDAGGIVIHEDLERGGLYGSFKAGRGSEIYELGLTEQAVTDIEAAIEGNGFFSVGLHNVTDDRDGESDGVRFDLPIRIQQLVLELRPGVGDPRRESRGADQ